MGNDVDDGGGHGDATSVEWTDADGGDATSSEQS